MVGYSGTPLPQKLGIRPGATVLLVGAPRGALAQAVHPAGGLWFAWPRRSSGVVSDLTEDVIREHALAAGLVDNKVCAVDDTWSALRIVQRKENRP